MKTIIHILSTIILVATASCQEIRTVKVTVTEEDGSVLEGAGVTVWFAGYHPHQSKSESGETNEQGVFIAKGAPLLRMEALIDKSGYYKTKSGRLSRKKDHDLIFVLKMKKNPIALYAKKYRIVAPVTDKKLGYDFKIGDWVFPHGRGGKADIFFLVKYEERTPKDYDYRLEVSFPNKLDGIQEFVDDQTSELKSKHMAPGDSYKAAWIQETRRRPATGRSGNRDTGRSYWMRVRSKTDENGNLISANYVKMYGDFPDMKYYFNPTPNDRNLEFDPDRNLFKNLKTGEHVFDP